MNRLLPVCFGLWLWWLPCAAAEIAPAILSSRLAPADVEKQPYRQYARECIELLMQHGTDTYGKVHSPMLMNILDVRTRTSPENPLALDEAFRVIRRERRGPAGCNLYPDQATIRAMHALSRVTGDARYARFADASIGYTMKHLVDEKGFFWWGWHRHYDAFRDAMTGHLGNPHEIHVQEAVWPLLWAVDRKAVSREIEAIWQWHVIDKTTGEVNRHGDGQRGCDFAMSGGEIVQAFAFLYRTTQDRQWLDRARLVADYFWKARNPKTNLTPNRPNAGPMRFDGSHFDTSITAFLCRGLLKASDFSGDAVFRDQAVAYLKAYAALGYDAASGEFWGSLRLDGAPVLGPRVVGDYAQYEPRGPIDLWQPYSAGYEHPLATAQVYAYAYGQTKDPALLEAARRWADAIRRAFPPRRCQQNTWYHDYAVGWAPHGTYAEHYGRAIFFLLSMRQLTGEAEYEHFARDVAREAISKLYYQGLLRGHPAKPYYEAMDGVGYLLGALVQLDQAIGGAQDRAESPLENW